MPSTGTGNGRRTAANGTVGPLGRGDGIRVKTGPLNDCIRTHGIGSEKYDIIDIQLGSISAKQ